MEKRNVIEVDDQGFQNEVLKCQIPVLVDFWGPMCGPCKTLEPVIEKLASDYSGRLKVAKVNVDSSPQTAIQYSVKSLPTLLIFNQGKVLNQFMGRPSPKALEKFIAGVL
jgi:thioredoxin 1